METALLEHDPGFANSDTDLAQLTRRRIGELVELGLVIATGKGKNIRYLSPPCPLLELTAPEAV